MIKKDSPDSLERRKLPRLKENIFIFYHLKLSSPDKFMAITGDISGGGLMFKTERSIPSKNEILDLEIYQPIDQRKIIFFSIFAKAKVIWMKRIEKASFEKGENKYKLGVEFIEIEKEDREKIANYIEERVSKK